MKRIAIVTDSSASLPREVCEAAAITVVPHRIRIGDREYCDGIDLDTAEFFRRLEAGSTPPTANQPGKAAFADTLRRLAQDYDQIVAVLISSKLSGTVSGALAAVQESSLEIPIEIVDSRNASLATGFQALRAADLARAGQDAGEIAHDLRANLDGYHLMFFADSLEYLEHGGRVGRATSLVGDLLALKPLLRIDEGQVVPVERARTRQRAIDQLQQFVTTWPSRIARLGIVYSSDRAPAERLVPALAPFVPGRHIDIAQLSPALCVHVGPGALGICLVEAES